MINKLEFNNLVISNKKLIQRVKAQTNQKLIQKIKNLKYALDKKPEHERNKERLGKTTLSLEELKKLKCFDLMKQVLVLDKSPRAILTNGLSAPEEIAMAMVALNKTMQEIVKSFQDKLGLTDENKKWREELMQASKRRIKILRTEMKRKNRQEIKEQKVMARKRTEWLKTRNAEPNKDNTAVKDVEDCAEENDDRANVSTLGYWKIEPIDDTKSAKPKIKRKQQRERVPKVNGAKENKRHGTVKHIVSTKSVELPTEKLESDATDKETIFQFNDTSFNSIDPDLKNDLQDKNRVTHKEEITHVVDPFFITASGENYISTAVVIRDGKVLEPQASKTNQDNRRFDKGAIRPTTDKHRSTSSFSGTRNKGIPSKNLTKSQETNNTNGLHPSWVAKQKYKPVIGSFQGKKIKFEDGDNFDKKEGGMNTSANSYDALVYKKKVTKLESNSNSQSLHPSWAAKQKFKATITDFEGKKITFSNEGDEEGATAKNVGASSTMQSVNKLSAGDSGLHPSWVAKQKQKPTIADFQGKKITFADD